MKNIKINDFEYEIEDNENIIGIITETDDSFGFIVGNPSAVKIAV